MEMTPGQKLSQKERDEIDECQELARRAEEEALDEVRERELDDLATAQIEAEKAQAIAQLEEEASREET